MSAAPETPDGVLRASGILGLGDDPPPEALAVALGRLGELADGAGTIERAALRDRAGELVDGAPWAPRLDDVLGPSSESWPESPDVPGPPEPDRLPLDALPAVLRDHVESVAGALQVPHELPMILGLGTVSAATTGRVVVEVDSARGWSEPTSIYAAVILPPGARKSPAYAHMSGPLREAEAEAVERAGPEVRKALDAVEVAEAKLRGAKTAAAKDKGSTREVEAARIELDRARAEVPPNGRLLAADITPEKVPVRMAEQGGRLAVLEPEPGPLQVLAGRYSDTPRLDALTRAWSGETLRVDRIGRDSVTVPRPSLTLALCLQPGVLAGLQGRDACRVEGVLGRVLWCEPPHGLGSRRVGHDVPELDRGAAHRYGAMIRALADWTPDPEPVVLTLTPDALDVVHDYARAIEPELPPGARLGDVADWASKGVGESVRVAALLALAERADDGAPLTDPLGPDDIRAGVSILRALESHALHVLGGLGLTPRLDLLRSVLDRARSLDDGERTVRELWQACRGRAAIDDTDDLRDVLDDLAERGCLRVRRMPPGPRGGRPSERIELHPTLDPEDPPEHPRNPQYLGQRGGNGGIGDVLGGREGPESPDLDLWAGAAIEPEPDDLGEPDDRRGLPL